MQDKVSILIPAYNAEGFLRRCIGSVLSQTHHLLEIVIVNDGSKDDTLSLCKQYATKDSRIVVINQDNQGVATTRNTALHAATGDYVLFVDADDWIEKDMVTTMLKAIHEAGGADIAFCKHDFAEQAAGVDRTPDSHQTEIWDQNRQLLDFMKLGRIRACSGTN